MPKAVIAEARLRERNQMTIPEAVVTAAGIGPGDKFVVELLSSDPDTLVLRRVRPSYAGALRGIYADPTDYLERERSSWG
jgi:hypothetical protein